MPFDPRAWPCGSRLPLRRPPDFGEASTASTTAVSAAEVEGEAWLSPTSDVERVFSSVLRPVYHKDGASSHGLKAGVSAPWRFL